MIKAYRHYECGGWYTSDEADSREPTRCVRDGKCWPDAESALQAHLDLMAYLEAAPETSR